MKVDLHCHTTASDGTLEPADLLQMAVDRHIDLLSITDHDTVAAYPEARAMLNKLAEQGASKLPRLLTGIEFSSCWKAGQIHIVGLGVAPECEVLQQAIAAQWSARWQRAERIAVRLEKKLRISGLLAAVQVQAGGSPPGRPHFAQVLVNMGLVADTRKAFDRYLGRGKPGDISSEWPPMESVVGWIRQSGGVAVLAHPESYRLSRTRLMRLAAEFNELGGHALEMVGSQHPAAAQSTVAVCRELGLAASTGSDYHGPEQRWRSLGNSPVIPAGLLPVWELPELQLAEVSKAHE